MGLWALQSLNLPHRPVAIFPAERVVEAVLVPQPTVSPPIPSPATLPPQLVTPAFQRPVRPTPKPEPVPAAKATPEAETPQTRVETSASTPTVPASSPAVAASPTVANAAPTATSNAVATPAPLPAPASPAPPRIELPSTQADYLNNPPPAYPRLSRRLGEQGKVVLRVLINTDGRAEQAQVVTSSGYERLDQTALATVQAWRYVPGKRNGVAEAMWFNIPIQFVLE